MCKRSEYFQESSVSYDDRFTDSKCRTPNYWTWKCGCRTVVWQWECTIMLGSLLPVRVFLSSGSLSSGYPWHSRSGKKKKHDNNNLAGLVFSNRTLIYLSSFGVNHSFSYREIWALESEETTWAVTAWQLSESVKLARKRTTTNSWVCWPLCGTYWHNH